MPSGSPRPKTSAGGVEIELVFVEPLPHAYECPVCQQALRYPVQFDKCAHHCCSNCLPQLIKEHGAKCPVDGKPIDRDQVYVDKNLQKTIQQLQVKCTFHENGCKWTGQLKEVPSHIPECENADMVCSKGCGVIYQRKDHEKHSVEDCLKRVVICEHCEKEIKKHYLDSHYKACPRFPLTAVEDRQLPAKVQRGQSRACLYGDGKVRGKHMSLFVGLLKGDYDVLLSWPFSHRVTFTLLDQCQDPAGRHNITYTVKPNTTKENRPFLGRPTSERNASFGAQKFCELGLLEKLDYVRDDVMFIKVQVDTEDMTPL
uniref:Uncharacterized protein n=1 Tax=Plectus sambesii TaxID=2011161 RepID=A0A914WZY5_9BILA